MADSERAGFRAFSGLRNDVPVERLPADALVEATNVDLDDSGMPRRRDGYALQRAGADIHSLWADGDLGLFVDGSTLRVLARDLTSAPIVSGFTVGAPMSYCAVGDEVFFCNGHERGALKARAFRPWGIRPPENVSAGAGAGNLPPGQYLVAATYRDAEGRESGAGEGALVTLDAEGGVNILVRGSANPSVAEVVLYLSTCNGATLYEAGVIAAPGHGDSIVATIAGPESELQRPLGTQFFGPPPAGHLLSHFRGRLLMAVGNRLRWSSAYGYDLWKDTDDLGFHARITMIAPADSGVFVGAGGKTWWLAGQAPEAFVVEPVSDDEPVEGSLVYAGGEDIKDTQIERPLPMWLTQAGLTVGMPDGSVRTMTEWRFTPPSRAAAMVRKAGETHQYLCSFIGA